MSLHVRDAAGLSFTHSADVDRLIMQFIHMFSDRPSSDPSHASSSEFVTLMQTNRQMGQMAGEAQARQKYIATLVFARDVLHGRLLSNSQMSVFPRTHKDDLAFFIDPVQIASRRAAWEWLDGSTTTSEEARARYAWWKQARIALQTDPVTSSSILLAFESQPVAPQLTLTLEECTPFEACLQLCTGGNACERALELLLMTIVVIYGSTGRAVAAWIENFYFAIYGVTHWTGGRLGIRNSARNRATASVYAIHIARPMLTTELDLQDVKNVLLGADPERHRDNYDTEAMAVWLTLQAKPADPAPTVGAGKRRRPTHPTRSADFLQYWSNLESALLNGIGDALATEQYEGVSTEESMLGPFDAENSSNPIRSFPDQQMDWRSETTVIDMHPQGVVSGMHRVRFPLYQDEDMRIEFINDQGMHTFRFGTEVDDEIESSILFALNDMILEMQGLDVSIIHNSERYPESYAAGSVESWDEWEPSNPDYAVYQTIHARIDAAVQKHCPSLSVPVLELCGADGALATRILQHGARPYTLVEGTHVLAQRATARLPAVHVVEVDAFDWLPSASDQPRLIISSGSIWTTGVGFEYESVLAHFKACSARMAPESVLIATGLSHSWINAMHLHEAGWEILQTSEPSITIRSGGETTVSQFIHFYVAVKRAPRPAQPVAAAAAASSSIA